MCTAQSVPFSITDNPWVAHPVIIHAAVHFRIPVLRVSFVSHIQINPFAAFISKLQMP
jgi:hypothetical protein